MTTTMTETGAELPAGRFSANERWLIGPPGTGKTTRIAGMVRGTADRYGADSVLVSSFSRAAAAEIASRDLGEVDPQRVGTLHGICYRLREGVRLAEVGEGVREWNATSAGMRWPIGVTLTAEQVDDMTSPFADAGATERGAGDELLSKVALRRMRMIDRRVWTDDERAFHRAWTDWKIESERTDFTDLIEWELENGNGAPFGARFGFFDEAQDFSPLEVALVRKWASHMDGAMLVGDPLQTIYTFKGADPDSVFPRDFPRERVEVLRQSYRVPRRVHAAACRWIKSQSREGFEYDARDADGTYRSNGASFTNSEVRQLVSEAEAAAKDGTVMLLASSGYMLMGALSEMRARGIPFHNPFRKQRGDWNPTRAFERLVGFLAPRPDLLGRDYEPRLWRASELFSMLDLVPVRDGGPLLRGAKAALERRVKDERRVPNALPLSVTDLRTYLTPKAIEDARAAMDSDTPWRLAARWAEGSTKSKLLAFALSVCERKGPRALVEPPKVIVGTIHSVKGAEADTVFMSQAMSASARDSSGSDPAARDAMQRAFYVGMTRARHNLIVSSCGWDGAGIN